MTTYRGPSPGNGRTVRSLNEEYDEGTNGTRLVQYFDKSRMRARQPQRGQE